jgi:hypothetical protein
MTTLQRYLTIYEPRTCLLCGKALHVRMCAPMRLAMSEPPPDDTPGNDCPDHGPYVEDCDKCD